MILMEGGWGWVGLGWVGMEGNGGWVDGDEGIYISDDFLA